MTTGLTRGLEQMAQFLHLFYRAVKDSNDDMLVDVMHVARAWFNELTGASIEAKTYNVQRLALAIIFGRDPFAGSRALLRAVAVKYPE